MMKEIITSSFEVSASEMKDDIENLQAEITDCQDEIEGFKTDMTEIAKLIGNWNKAYTFVCENSASIISLPSGLTETLSFYDGGGVYHTIDFDSGSLKKIT